MLNTSYEVDITTLVDYTGLRTTNLIKVSAAATASRTITLPLARESDQIFVYNASAYQATIAVQSGDTLVGPTTLPSGATAEFQASAQSVWYSFGSAGLGSLISFRQVCPVTAFTDGGSTSGTLVLGVTIPAGAVYARTLLSGLVGFTGDVSATATLGDGSDVDRYNTGTPNVFVTAAQGVDAGVPSGTLFHNAAIATVTLTVTSNSDFTLVKTAALGSVNVTMFYYSPF
jgi:hypothetical protein